MLLYDNAPVVAALSVYGYNQTRPALVCCLSNLRSRIYRRLVLVRPKTGIDSTDMATKVAAHGTHKTRLIRVNFI
jgi:hypothetical protein